MAIRDYIINWGSLDEKSLDDLIEKWNLDEKELVERTEEMIKEIHQGESICSDIIFLIDEALNMIKEKIEEYVNEYLENDLDTDKYKYKYNKFEYDACNFLDYLDSFINDALYLEEIVTNKGVEDKEALIEYLEDKGMIERIDND